MKKKRKNNISAEKKKRDYAEKHVSRATENSFIIQVRRIAETLLESEGMELVHLEYLREKSGRVLRIFMDKPGGVTLDDCVYISRQMGDILDVEMEEDVRYRLEVSSPGTDRPLGKKEDFVRFKGFEARIKTEKPVDGQKNFRGMLQGMTEDCVKLKLEDKTADIPYGWIIKAHLINYNGDSRC